VRAAPPSRRLTPPQLKTVETFYGGLHNSKGELIFSGQALAIPYRRFAMLTPVLVIPSDLGVPERPHDWQCSISIVTCRSSAARSLRRRRRPGSQQVQGARRQLLLRRLGRPRHAGEHGLCHNNLKKKMGPQDDFVRLFMVPAWRTAAAATVEHVRLGRRDGPGGA
jgi:hypothetical protein